MRTAPIRPATPASGAFLPSRRVRALAGSMAALGVACTVALTAAVPTSVVGPVASARPSTAAGSGSSTHLVEPATTSVAVPEIGPLEVPAATSTETTAAVDAAAPPASTRAVSSDVSPPVVPVAPAQVADPAARMDVTGTVTRAYVEAGRTDDGHEDAHVDHASDLLTAVQPDDGDAVPVPTSQLADVPSGATVHVVVEADPVVVGVGTDDLTEAGHVVLSADVLSLPSQEVTDLPAPQDGVAAAVTPTTHTVTVVRVRPYGVAADSTTLAQVMNAVNGPVRSFWSEQTGSRVQLTAPTPSDGSWFQSQYTCSQYQSLVTEVASWAGFSMTGRTDAHLLIYMPQGAPGCYSGLAQVKPKGDSNVHNNGWAYVTGTDTSLVAHELGHNLGLGHSDGLQCSSAADGVYSSGFSSSCSVRGYGDWYDVMGISWSNLGTLNAMDAAYLGGLSSDDYVSTSTSVRVSLLPISGSTGVRAIKVTDGTDVYWVEYRPASGRDAYLSSPSLNYRGLQSGVLVRRVNPNGAQGSTPYASLLLDASPSAQSGWSSDWQQALVVGGRITLASGRVVIGTEAIDSASADVSVTVNGVAASPAPVLVSSPGSGSKGGWVVRNGLTSPDAVTNYQVKSQANGGVVLQRSGQPGAPASAMAGLRAELPPGTYTVRSWTSDEPEDEPSGAFVDRTITVG